MYERKKIAVYGLSANTQEFIKKTKEKYIIAGLLDAYRQEGEMYGYKILSLDEVVEMGIKTIVIVARPSSRRIIVNRIKEICIEHAIDLYDVEGRDLLKCLCEDIEKCVDESISKEELLKKIDEYEVISFDIFDTLLVRKTLYPTDVFKLVEYKLIKEYGQGYDYAQVREKVELDLSRENVPTIKDIYMQLQLDIGVDRVIIERMQEMEWEVEKSLLIPRYDMCDVLKYAIENKKRIYLVSDMYYSSEQLEKLLISKDIDGDWEIIVSCEYGVTKSKGLFDILKKNIEEKTCLHIGDNYFADVESANKYGIEGIWVRSGFDMFEMMPWAKEFMGCDSISERIKQGIFIARLFNSPFALEQGKVIVKQPDDLGYLFIAPILSDFVIWLFNELSLKEKCNVFFAARDGYLIKTLYDILLDKEEKIEHRSIYLLISRISAIVNTLFKESDVKKVMNIDFNGSFLQMMKTRFLLKDSELNERNENIDEYMKKILHKAAVNRKRYLDYVSKIDLNNGDNVFYDFVSSGTCQMALEKIINKTFEGYYFIRVDEDDYEKRRLDINSYYSRKDAESAGIYEEYFVLENLLTAPKPSFCCFSDKQEPVYFIETRNQDELEFINCVHKGILQYFKEYVDLFEMNGSKASRRCSEVMLSLIHKVIIENDVFENMTWEDGFFQRNAKIKDML